MTHINLRQFRQKNKLRQCDMAKSLGVSLRWLQTLEKEPSKLQDSSLILLKLYKKYPNELLTED